MAVNQLASMQSAAVTSEDVVVITGTKGNTDGTLSKKRKVTLGGLLKKCVAAPNVHRTSPRSQRRRSEATSWSCTSRCRCLLQRPACCSPTLATCCSGGRTTNAASPSWPRWPSSTSPRARARLDRRCGARLFCDGTHVHTDMRKQVHEGLHPIEHSLFASFNAL